MPDVKVVGASVVSLGNAILAAVIALASLGWSDVETGAAFLMVNTTVGVGVAIYAHVKPGTAKEPVAIGVAVTVWSESVFGGLVAFDAFEMTVEKAVLLQGVVIALVGLVALFVTRENTVPVEDAQAQIEAVRAGAARRMPPDGH